MELGVSINKAIRLNIGGTTYKCFTKTLTAFPDSKLANLDKATDAFDFEQNEYFFDRNPILFAYILDSFRKEAIHLPKDICGTTFRKELEFWEIPLHHVAPCCWEALYGSEDDIATVNSLVQICFGKEHNLSLVCYACWFCFAWFMFTIHLRNVWSMFISFVILTATLADSLATVDTFEENFTQAEMKLLSKLAHALDYSNATLERMETMKQGIFLVYTNVLCNVILTLELVIGFVVCQDKKTFVCCFSRLIACFGYLSYWTFFTLYLNMTSLGSINAVIVQFACWHLAVFKIARLLYLTKSVPAFRLICLSLASSKQELKILVFLFGIFVFVFGYILYAAEVLHNPKITNIFTAIYWALITLTTVGYGDYVPVTAVGHFIAGACAVCGVLVLALPVGIITSKFYKYYDFYNYTRVHTSTRRERECFSHK